jgi:transposase
MTKSNKNLERKAQREAKAVQQHKKSLRRSALAEYEANTLVIGIDLGDKTSTYCVRRRADRQVVMEGVVTTSAEAVLEEFEGLRRQLMVVETGTHSRWVAQLLGMMGQEVIVANARKLKLISENNQKSDRVDARLLSELGCTNVEWLHGVYVRSDGAQRDLMVVRAREALVEVRTGLINHVRGTAKSYGSRLEKCGAERFAEVAEGAPEGLQPAIGGVVRTLRTIDEEIKEYDRQMEEICTKKYPQTRWLRQVKGVGPVTALTYVLTIEDAQRFEHSRDVGAYLGMVVKKRQSGARDPQLGISKTGDEMLRKLLVNCAHYILGPMGEDSDLRRWGLKLVEASMRAGKKQGARKRAAVGVARKLAVLLHRLWVAEAEYEPLYQAKAADQATNPAA